MNSTPQFINHNEELPGRDTTTVYQPETVAEATQYLETLLLRAQGAETIGSFGNMKVTIKVRIKREEPPVTDEHLRKIAEDIFWQIAEFNDKAADVSANVTPEAIAILRNLLKGRM